MPVFLVKATNEGLALVLSSTSMYSGQLDQLTSFSESDMSWAAFAVGAMVLPPDPVTAVLFPLLPQAARAVIPAPAAPTIRVRRETRPRASAAERMGGSGSVMVAPAGGGGTWWAGGGVCRGAETVAQLSMLAMTCLMRV